MMKHLFLCLLCFSVSAFSQEGKGRYLFENAVPLVNGEVVFEHLFEVSDMSDKELYSILLEWAKIRFVTDNDHQGRVLLADKEKRSIACQGKEPLFFKRTGWVRSNADIKFRLFIYCMQEKCRVVITNISYVYDTKELVTAEEYITDKHALNKKKTKLDPVLGKFRVKTIDLVDEIFEDINNILTE